MLVILYVNFLPLDVVVMLLTFMLELLSSDTAYEVQGCSIVIHVGVLIYYGDDLVRLNPS